MIKTFEPLTVSSKDGMNSPSLNLEMIIFPIATPKFLAISFANGSVALPENIFTGVFYINTCNGGTKFKNGPKVKSVANRVVIFDTNFEHAAVTCTDKQSRVVVNFNFSR